MNYTIGLDIGGTKIKGVVVDSRGKVFRTASALIDAPDDEKTILKQIRLVAEKLNATKENILGMGVGVPGFVRGKLSYTGRNLSGLRGKPLQATLQKIFGLPVFIENDANCFALAEHSWGAAKKLTNVVGLIIGTGIGTGIIIDKKLYKGSFGRTGEFGQVIMTPDKATIESYLSGPGLMQHYYAQGGSQRLILPTDIFTSQDRVAKKWAAEALDLYGRLFAMIINVLNPEMIVIGGGLSKSLNLKDIRAATKPYLSSNLIFNSCAIVKNKLGADSGALGAAALPYHEQKAF